MFTFPLKRRIRFPRVFRTDALAIRAYIFLVVLNLLTFLLTTLSMQGGFLASTTSSSYAWASVRALHFSEVWESHKIRNIATYICLSSRHLPGLSAVAYYLLHCPDVFYDARFDKLFDVPKWCLSHTCLKRYGHSTYLYATFVLNTFEYVTFSNVTPAAASKLGKVAVLVEPRLHPLYEYTVKQVMMTLGDSWSLQLFVSSENEESVRRSFDVRQGGLGENIVITRLSDFGLDDLARYGNRVQSALSAHKVLSRSIVGEHIFGFKLMFC